MSCSESGRSQRITMYPTFHQSDGGFIDKFQRTSAPPQEQQYGAQPYKHMVAMGETRAPHQHTAVEERAPRPGLRMHSETVERSKLPRHRMGAPHDSNDDDGETSSASEDSAPSGGFPSPSRSKARPRVPAAKRPDPPTGFSEGHPKRSCPMADPQPKWSPVSDSGTTDVNNFRTSGNIPARQLPRMAALEEHPLEQSQHQHRLPSHHLMHHDPHRLQHRHQQPPQLPPPQFHPSQESRHLPAVGSHGPTSGMIGAVPMQLPPLSMVRPPVPPPPPPPVASIGPVSRVSSSPSSPGMHIASNPLASSSSGHYHYQRQSHHPTHVSHLQADTPTPRQLPPPHSSSSSSGSSSSGSVVMRPWMSRREDDHMRQVPRIEALSRSDGPPMTAAHGRWTPMWSASTQDHSDSYDHRPTFEVGLSVDRGAPGHIWRNGRKGMVGDWVNPGGYHPRLLNVSEEPCHPMGPPQPNAQVLKRQEATSSRTPSPAFRQETTMHHQQARSTPSTVNSTPPLPERTGKGRWKCAAGSGGRDPHRDDLTGEESKQILEQYIAVLNPKASREVWSHEEEEVLWRAQKEYGNAWNYISKLLPGRSENAVKNHWYTQMRMFIGQRGNHPANSKPCPPTSTTEGPKSTSEKKSFQSEAQSRKDEDDKADCIRPPAESEANCKAFADNVDNAENAARAEAVAALGLLFSTPRCGEGDARSSSSASEVVSPQRQKSCG